MLAGWAAGPAISSGAERPLDYEVRLEIVSASFDGETCWAQARAGVIPGEKPVIVLTMQKTLLSTSDVYFALNDRRTEDLGRTWTKPTEHPALGRRVEADGSISNINDFTPKWHARSRKLLGTGVISNYVNQKKAADPNSHVGYAVYDSVKRSWGAWKSLALPEGRRPFRVSAGSTQRVDLEDGTILLPVYFKEEGVHAYGATVLRCAIDGETLTYLGQGDTLTFPFDVSTIPESRPHSRRLFDARQAGLFEPSLTRFQGRFYLTMRNRHAGYVAISEDGQRFDTPRVWTFDDGELLGNYNTQQHWVTHSDGLYLTYTRRGVGNDRVFRHRAPILIARVHPERMCLMRATERVLIPERGVDIGNFGVTEVSPQETWVTVSEMMFTRPGSPPPDAFGANNHVYAARIIWNRRSRSGE